MGISIALSILISIIIYSIGRGIQSSTANRADWSLSVFSWFPTKVLGMTEKKSVTSWWGPRTITADQPPIVKGFIGKVLEYFVGDIYTLGSTLMHLPFFLLALRILIDDYTLINSLWITLLGLVVYKVFTVLMTKFTFKLGTHWALRLVISLALITAMIWGGHVSERKYIDNGGLIDQAVTAQHQAQDQVQLLQDSIQSSHSRLSEIDKKLDSIKLKPLSEVDSFWINLFDAIALPETANISEPVGEEQIDSVTNELIILESGEGSN